MHVLMQEYVKPQCELTRSCLAVKHQLSDRGSPTVLFILLLESVVRPERHDLRSTYGPEECRGQGLVPRMTSVLFALRGRPTRAWVDRAGARTHEQCACQLDRGFGADACGWGRSLVIWS